MNANGVTTNVFDLVVYSVSTQKETTYVIGNSAGNDTPVWLHDGNSILTGVMRVDLKTGESQVDRGDYTLRLACRSRRSCEPEGSVS